MTGDGPKVQNPIQVFRSLYRRHAAEGDVRPLRDYLEIFPGSRNEIAREYLELEAEATGGPLGGEPEDAGQIAHYRLERELGRGGQGIVYRAQDLKLHRPVALKVLTNLAAAQSSVLLRFRREAEVASKLDHPGICTVYDTGVHGGTPYLVMRYVEGTTLADRIARARAAAGLHDASTLVEIPERRLPGHGGRAESSSGDTSTMIEVREVIALIEKVARALHVAHEAGIVHRDVKPSNIMVTDEDAPVLLDLGLAREIEPEGPPLTVSGEVFGTPHYMAPEQLSAEHVPDRRIDIYALGVTLYEALTLRRPFDAPTRDGLYRRILQGGFCSPRELNPVVSRDLETVLATAMAREAGRRYVSALAFAEDLRRVRMHEPILARPPGNLTRLGLWMRRNPGLSASLVSSFLVLAAGLATGWILYRQAADSARVASEALAGYERLADLKTIRDLEEWAGALHPPIPEMVEGPRGMKAWLGEARVLLGRQDVHRLELERLRLRAGRRHDGKLVFADAPEAWRYDILLELDRALEALPGRIAAIERRVALTAEIGQATLVDAREAWDAAIGRVRADPRYRELELRPQRGLVPLGRDPTSGYEEFAVYASGSVPARDPQSGRLRLEPDAAIVLVMLPGLPPSSSRASPGSDALPPFGPYLIGKHEVTQAQWQRIMGTEPSQFPVGVERVGQVVTPRNPVENVTWWDCAELVRRLDLELPNEGAWEHAALAGAGTAYAFGESGECLEDRENVASLELDSPQLNLKTAPWKDGHAIHAPVGSYEPNAFGLHDVHGNVSEWCADWFTTSPTPSRHRVNRGGSWYVHPEQCIPAIRHHQDPGSKNPNLGVRVARRIR